MQTLNFHYQVFSSLPTYNQMIERNSNRSLLDPNQTARFHFAMNNFLASVRRKLLVSMLEKLGKVSINKESAAGWVLN